MNKIWKQRQGAKLRLAVDHADTIKKAIEDSIDVSKVVDAWLNAHYTKEVTGAQARQWAKVNIHVDNRPMDKALKYLYADSYVLGQDIAIQTLAHFAIKKAATITLSQMQTAQDTQWAKWKPGYRAASQLLKPSSGLNRLMESRGVTLVGLGDTTVSRIGTILAGALQVGATPSSVAGSIESLLAPLREDIAAQLNADINLMMSDSERALMIAQTEMSRAVSVANREMYIDSGVEQVEWLTADPCDECQENEDVSPIGINEEFPSGDTEPPAHPNCVCALAPYEVQVTVVDDNALQAEADTPVDTGNTIIQDLIDQTTASHVPTVEAIPTPTAAMEIISNAGVQPLMPYEWNPTIRGSAELSPADFVQATKDIVEIANSPVVIQIQEEALMGVLKDGVMRTLDNVTENLGGRTISTYYRDAREALENDMWNIPRDEVQPIYGYMDTPRAINTPDVYQYGNIKMILKDELKGRTTFTIGDSLNSRLTPLQITDALAEKVTNEMLSAAQDGWQWKPKGTDYIEAQIHGGVSVTDIKAIDLTIKNSPFTVNLSEETINKLIALGIEIITK